MERRVDKVVGAAAGSIAIGTIGVFGYLSLTTGVNEGGSGAAELRSGAAVRPSITDPDYRFRLTAPDPTWQVYDHATTDAMWFDNVATMESRAGQLFVMITRVGDVDNDVAVARAKQSLTSVQGGRALSWVGRTVTELTSEQGGEQRYDRVFVRDGFMYHLALYPGKLTERERNRVWSSFALLPGKVEPRPLATPPRVTRGVDWRIAGGRWESVRSGLAVRPPAGWRILTGSISRSVTGDGTEVMLFHEVCGCRVLIGTGAFDEAARVGDAKVTMEILGTPRELFEMESLPGHRQWATTVPAGSETLAIEVKSPAADGERGLAALREALAGITLLGGDERARAVDDLLAQPYHPTEIGPDWAYRAGTFAHYPSGLVWRQPSGELFTVSGPEEAAGFLGATLFVNAPRTQIGFAVALDSEAGPGFRPASWLDEHVAKGAREIDMSALSAAFGRGAETSWREGKLTWVHRVTSWVVPGPGGDRAFRVHVFGPRDQLPEHQAMIAAAVRGLAVETLPEPEERRWGFRVALPGWERSDGQKKPDVISYEWEHRELGMIRVAAQLVPDGPSSPVNQYRARRWASNLVERGLAPEPQVTREDFAGAPAIRLGWHEGRTLVTAVLLERHDILYTIVTRGTDDTVAISRNAFQLVGPAP